MKFIFTCHVPHDLRDLVYTALYYSNDSDTSLAVHFYGSGSYSNGIEPYDPDNCNGLNIACVVTDGKVVYVAPSFLEKYPSLWHGLV